jgi:hypothetical protein
MPLVNLSTKPFVGMSSAGLAVNSLSLFYFMFLQQKTSLGCGRSYVFYLGLD